MKTYKQLIEKLEKENRKLETKRFNLSSRLHHFQWSNNAVKENEYLGKLEGVENVIRKNNKEIKLLEGIL